MIVVLMGAPGAGKSTWVRNNWTGNEHVFNIDAIRANHDLDVNAYTNFMRMRAIERVVAGDDLIADATHTIKRHRDIWRHLGQKWEIPTRLVLLDTNLDSLLNAQNQREFPVKRSVVVSQYKQIQIQKRSIDREGWDSIEVITR